VPVVSVNLPLIAMSHLRLPILALLLAGSLAQAETQLTVAGSGSLVAPFSGAASLLKQQGITLKVVNDSSSSAAIAGVGEKLCDLALSTRSVLPAERAAFPDKPMAETVIGYQALALIVSNDVWEGGIRSLSRKEIIDIYEGKITEWKKLGGPDRKIKFFNPERGKGPWEFFVGWLYGEVRKAPVGSQFETVASPEETANLVEFNGGSLAVIPPNHADGKGTHMIAIRDWAE